MAVLAEAPRKIDYNNLSVLELIKVGEREVDLEKKPTRVEVIPLDKVITEQALIDDSHADELGESLITGRGQLAPIVVRARLDPTGEVLYDIIDGFHRAEGLKRKGGVEIKANVLYGCSDEELYDQRILAASSVRSVQFARIVEWITKSWETTQWSKKGLSVTQAFAKTVIDREKSRGVDLSSEELFQLKEWVRGKCKRWGRRVGGTYQILNLVSNADPDLVRQVRLSGGGKDREGKITPDRLRIVVEAFPSNFQAQRALLRLITERRYYAEEAVELVGKAKQLIPPEMSNEKEIYETADRITIETKVSVKAGRIANKSKFGSSREYKRYVGTDPLLQQAAEIIKLRGEMGELKGELRRSYWWRQADYLTVLEKVCLERILFGNQHPALVFGDLKITETQGLMLIKSAVTKRHEQEPERTPLLE